MAEERVRRRDVARLLVGQVAQGIGMLSAASAAVSGAAADSFASLRPAPSSADASRPILGRTTDGSMWVRARVADPAVAPTVEVPDGTVLVRLLRDGDVGAGPILAPLTAAALAGTARAVGGMDVAARTNALSAIADLIRRARPESGALRVALARSTLILGLGHSGPLTAASLDHLADALAADLGAGSARLVGRLDALSSIGIFLAGRWSRQSLGDPWLVEALLGNDQRVVVAARAGGTGEGDLVEGWVDPAMRRRVELVSDSMIAASLRARRCEVVLLMAEYVRPDGTVVTAPGSLAIALIAQHYRVPVIAVDLVSALVTGPVDLPGEGLADPPGMNGAAVDFVPPGLIAQTISAGSAPIE
jgi:hypothetical protein